jgi:putative peptidoglycan lipid II flippase
MPFYRRFVNHLRAKKANFHQSPRLLRHVSVVAVCTLVSRLLGFTRDILFASLFGASAAFDAFLVAFKIPNFFRRLFGEGAFSQAFVPVLAEWTEKHDHETVVKFISRIFSNLTFMLLILVALVECFTPWIVNLFAPGFMHDPLRHGMAVQILRITFGYVLLISLTALAGAVLNTHRRFAAPAFAPVLLNVALILMAVLFAPGAQHPINVIAIGVLLGGVLQLILQVPFLFKLKLMPRFDFNWHDPGVKRVLKLMVPALFGVSVAQISLLVDNFFASFLPRGSLSWLYYSDRLTYLPLGVIGVAIATVVLPELSRQRHSDQQSYSKMLDWALQKVLWFGAPAAVGLMVLAGPILSTLFLHGHFLARDVIMTRRSLCAFALGLPAFMLIKILASAFYAQQNVKTPVKIAALALLVNVIGNILLIHLLAHAGLALSTSIAAYVNVGFLWYLLVRKRVYQPAPGWCLWMVRLVCCCIVMGGAMVFLSPSMSVWLRASSAYKISHLSFFLLVGVLSYVTMWWLLRARKSSL